MNLKNCITLYNFITSETKKSGKTLNMNTRCLLKNSGLATNSITVDSFCRNFNLEPELENIMDFITNPDNSYELSKYGHNSQVYIANAYTHSNKRVSKDIGNNPENYGLDEHSL